MARRSLPLLLALLCLLPAVAAWAGPEPLNAYVNRLEQVTDLLDRSLAADAPGEWLGHLEQALALLPHDHVVQTPAGETTIDHGYLRRRIEAGGLSRVDRQQARDLAAAQLESARQLADGQTDRIAGIDTRAQERSRVLAEQAKNRTRLLERILDWLSRFFGRAGTAGQTDRADATQWAIWLAAAISAVGIALLAYGLVGGKRRGQAGREGTEAAANRPSTPRDLWIQAKTMSAEGDHLGALRLGYLALLRHWDELGLLRYMPTLTNREHERQLRRTHPALASLLSPLTTLLETRLYAGQSASAEDFAKGATMIEHLWREGDAVSKNPSTNTGSSPA